MTEPSTGSLANLPSVADLLRQSKALAMLDAIVSPEWEYRYYSFDSHWGSGEFMASMRNGSGDGYFILFDEHGAAIKGFDHEAAISPWATDPPSIWPGMYDGVPDDFSSFLNEPAFSMEAVTFCVWRRYSDTAWQRGPVTLPAGDDPDGSDWLLAIFDGDPETYQAFARDYYEVELPLEAIESVYRLAPLTDEIVLALNSELTAEDVVADALEIGYP